MQRIKQKFCFYVFMLFVAFFAMTNSVVGAFDFQRDVASRFFWTDSYKAKHPEPKNNMPKTMAEYYREANKAAEKNNEIPSPKFQRDEKLVDLPDPNLSVRKYNNPPGSNEINLNKLIKTRKVNSTGVVSPVLDKIVYSSVYYYPSSKTVASELVLMKLDTSKSLQQRIETAHVNQGKRTIYKSGMERFDLEVYRTLTIVDWSEDGKKIAVKEKIAHSVDGLWKTNLLVYDMTTGQMRDLSEVREAILYHWRENHKLTLRDYRWDIYPIGWDVSNPDRIIVFAYAATGAKPKYLGAWSIDFKGERTILLSETETNFEVSQNGLCIKVKYD